MGLFGKLFGGKKQEATRNKNSPHFAFVLLQWPVTPDPLQIVEVFPKYGETGELLSVSSLTDGSEIRADTVTLDFNTGESVIIVLADYPIPGDEAESAVEFSLSSRRTEGWELPAYKAHLVVIMQGEGSGGSVERLSRYTALLAAVIEASGAVGVYWGEAGATHSRDFFLHAASQKEMAGRLMLWSGVSFARERDGRFSMLSRGMKMLGLPDVLLVSEKMTPGDMLTTAYDILMYVVSRGEALPDGDTIGGSPEEKVLVRYVRSPLGGPEKVCRLEFP